MTKRQESGSISRNPLATTRTQRIQDVGWHVQNDPEAHRTVAKTESHLTDYKTVVKIEMLPYEHHDHPRSVAKDLAALRLDNHTAKWYCAKCLWHVGMANVSQDRMACCPEVLLSEATVSNPCFGNETA